MATEKTTAPKAFCFVLMPFEDSFGDVYELGIREACTQAGAYCERVDEQIFHESILDRIYNQIAKADIVIADMTGRNANVFYEVGYAHALGKRTILLTRKAEDIPFDLKHFQHIVYGEHITDLRDDLTKRVQWCVENPVETAGKGTIDIELYLGDENLSSGDVVHTLAPDSGLEVILTIHNASGKTFTPGSFKLGAITEERFGLRNGRQIRRPTHLPSGDYLHMYHDFDTLFPQAYTSCNFDFLTSGLPYKNKPITFRVFTESGTRDYKLAIRPVED